MEAGGWSDRVTYSEDAEGSFAYRPGQLIGRDLGGRTLEARLHDMGFDFDTDHHKRDDEGTHWFWIEDAAIDVLAVIEELRDDSFMVEPNYVLFAHDLSGSAVEGNPLYGNPLYGNPLYGNPLYGNPLYGNPLYGNPLYGNPLYGNPLYGNPLYGNPAYGSPHKDAGIRKSSARPADARTGREFNWHGVTPPTVIIIDTGFAEDSTSWPAALQTLAGNTLPKDIDKADPGGDKELDPVAGHGTFIAGVVELLTPGCTLKVEKALDIEGDVDEWVLKGFLDHLVAGANDHTIVNLSLGGYAPSRGMWALARTVRRLQAKKAVIVASAGNDGIPRPSYPACFRGVVSVGALGPYGPAAFSNLGPWVRACAPGVELVSTFFDNFNGPTVVVTGAKDPDQFKGWAEWSGTSFSAPVVVAALAREMGASGCDAKTAVKNIIDAPGLARIPGMGTIVNIA